MSKQQQKATIHYYDIGDYLSREQKLRIIKDATSFENLPMQTLQPNEHGDWISLRNEGFGAFIPLGDKDDKTNKETFFVPFYSNGLKTQRDAWCYNSNSALLKSNIQTHIDFYNEQREAYTTAKLENPKLEAKNFISYDNLKISWSDNPMTSLSSNKVFTFDETAIVRSVYRPFFKQHLFFDRILNERVYQIPKLFPNPSLSNLVICVSANSKDGSVLMSNCIPDLHFNGDTQCFPLYYYEENSAVQKGLFDTQDPEQGAGFGVQGTNEGAGFGVQGIGNTEPKTQDPKPQNKDYIRRDAISDFILGRAQKMYGLKRGTGFGVQGTNEGAGFGVQGTNEGAGFGVQGVGNLTQNPNPHTQNPNPHTLNPNPHTLNPNPHTLTKEDIFYYVYGFLHAPSYREMFANDLKKMLPRLPLVEDVRDFWAFSKAGRQLAELHLHYESVPPAAGVITLVNPLTMTDTLRQATIKEMEYLHYRVTKMRFPKKDQKDSIIYNNQITIDNIPPEAYEYVVNGKSAIEWVMERYQITTHKESGITNNPNDWATETGNPRYILDLLLSVINVSLQTVEIVNNLPKIDFSTQ